MINDNIPNHINLIKMWNYFKTHVKGFWQGAIGGAMVCTPFILRVDFHVPESLEYVIKGLGIITAAILTGMGKVIGEDVEKKTKPYMWRVLYWFSDLFKRKKKKDERYKQNGQQKRA